jgi:hypothetical protein
MKCINCGTDNNLKDRTANYGRCKQCQHPFVFEPTSSENKFKITDPFFQKLLTDISAGDTLYYTPKQLLYFLDRRLKNKSKFTFWGWLVGYIFFVVFFSLWFGGILTVGVRKFPVGITLSFALFNGIGILLAYKQSQDPYISKYNRLTVIKILVFLGWFTLLGGTILSWLLAANPPISLLIAASGIAAIYLSNKQAKTQPNFTEQFRIEKSQLSVWMSRWQQFNGTLERFLPPPTRAAISGVADKDVTVYSFDRLIVTDSDTIAHFLIANNFHFEHNCAILSIDGYPQSIFETVMEMVLRNPDLEVYAVHDCSPAGMNLVRELSTSDRWFADRGIPIIDLGLLPRQIIDLESSPQQMGGEQRNLFIQNSQQSRRAAQGLSREIVDSLTPAEVNWLAAGNFVELESFIPRRLLQILHQGINRSHSLTTVDDGGGMILIDNYGSDSSTIYTVDSFG